jgi:hypothetical protein
MDSKQQIQNEKSGQPNFASARNEKISKKEQILSLFLYGISDVEDLSAIIGVRPSYVGSVLQEAGLVKDYFDLYTSTSHPMNIYSKFFVGKLGFKDEEAAKSGVETIDKLYQQFGIAQDRAGQHHALMMALTMFDRARWTGKGREAEIYRQWLMNELEKANFDEREFDSEQEEIQDDVGASDGQDEEKNYDGN